MLRYIIACLLALLPLSLFAQDEFPYKLKGYLGVKGGETFNYELELKNVEPGKYTGFAYTFAEPKKDVKTAVTMYLDKANGKVLLVEDKIIHNNGFTSVVLICLLEAELSMNVKEGNLSGRIVTKMVSSSLPCSDGSLVFTNKSEIEAFMNETKPQTAAPAIASNQETVKPAPKDTAAKKFVYVDKRPPVNETVTAPKKDVPKVVTITEGKDNAIQWEGNTIKMIISDDNTIDGDIVTIMYNGVIVLDNYTLTKTPKTLHLDVGSNELNVISILAGNEGAEPPNTASITLYDGEKKYDIIAHNKVGKLALIKIKKRL